MCAEKGEQPEKTYRGSFNVRVSPELHKTLAIYSSSHGQTLNSTVEEAIKKLVMA
jgi:predicted HicB family RNase H-like nuclease